MHRPSGFSRSAFVLLGVVALAGCLRAPTNLGGKTCKLGSEECGAGYSCAATNAAGESLGTPPASGLCQVAPLDCGPGRASCPFDAGAWVCAPHLAPTAGCFGVGTEALAGSVCMVGIGACRGYGVYGWDGQDGGCILPAGFNGASRASGECTDAGGAGPLCLCDGIDNDCDGVVDDFPINIKRDGLEPQVSRFLIGGCTAGTSVILEPTADAGACAYLTLGHAYSVSELVVGTAAVAAGSCGNPASGTGALLGFAGLRPDGGAFDVQLKAVAQTVSFVFPAENLDEALICVGSGEPIALTSLNFGRALDGRCDER